MDCFGLERAFKTILFHRRAGPKEDDLVVVVDQVSVAAGASSQLGSAWGKQLWCLTSEKG